MPGHLPCSWLIAFLCPAFWAERPCGLPDPAQGPVHAVCASLYISGCVLASRACAAFAASSASNQASKDDSSMFTEQMVALYAQVNDRVQMRFNPDLCPEAISDGLAMTTSQPYPFGVDPTWHGTRTELQFLNSVKMKLSILLGEPFLT